MKQLVFLTYIPRSGSTFLSKLLDEYKEIGVSIEANIPDGFRNGKCFVTNDAELEEYLDRLYNDDKFRFWGIPRKNLKTILRKKEYPLKFNDILPVILSKYFKTEDKKIWILKLGYYINYVNQLKKLFPNSKFIFIIRDPRGIFNSQRTSMLPNKNKPMARNTFHSFRLARKFNKVSLIIEKYLSKDWMYVVQYENLIKDTKNELIKILNFLGVSNIKNKKRNYFKKIPEAQRNLHKKINSIGLLNNINKWEKSLSNSEIYIIQKISGENMVKYGYIPKAINTNIFLYLSIIIQLLIYIISGTRNKFYKILR